MFYHQLFAVRFALFSLKCFCCCLFVLSLSLAAARDFDCVKKDVVLERVALTVCNNSVHAKMPDVFPTYSRLIFLFLTIHTVYL